MRNGRIVNDPSPVSASAPGAISILILSEIRFLREGLAEALKDDNRVSISGLCADLDATVELSGDLEPTIVLVDAATPKGTGAVRRLHSAAPDTKVVVFAVTESEENIIAWAEAGAAGYIPRSAALRDLIRLLLAISEGEQICSRRVASALLRRVGRAINSGGELTYSKLTPMLTVREQEIVRLVSAGMSNKEIARHLNIEVSTTKSHVHNLLAKLNLQRRGQVAFWRRDNAANLY